MTIFGTHILISYHPRIPQSLYNQRWGTMLSFKTRAGQHTLHVKPLSSFVARCRTSIIVHKLWLPNIPDFST